MSTDETLAKNGQEHLSQLCQNMLEKTADYLNGELTGAVDDYRLLEKMNIHVTKKYSEMRDISVGISSAIDILNKKYADLIPYLELIDQLDENVSALEQAAYKVDSYSKRLEAKFKQLEKS